MLVDTNASVTVLNKKIFEKLPLSSKSLLSPVKLNLVTATGETSAFLGKLSVDIKIENKYFSQDILIADMQNDGILGVDFLSCHKCDVLLSKSCLLSKGNKIPCYHFDKNLQPNICRIAVTQDVVVPPESEVIVPGKIIDPIINVHNAMVSRIPSFVNKTGLLMAYV